MEENVRGIETAESFTKELEAARKKTGREPLSDHDLFIMTCEKIMRTYTFEEKGYR